MDNNSTTMMSQQERDQMEKQYLEGLVREYQDESLKLNEDYDRLKKRKRELDVKSSAVDVKMQKALEDSAFAKKMSKKCMFQIFCLMVKQNDPTMASLDDASKFVDGFDKGLDRKYMHYFNLSIPGYVAKVGRRPKLYPIHSDQHVTHSCVPERRLQVLSTKKIIGALSLACYFIQCMHRRGDHRFPNLD
jgi:hypothetical protein